MSATFHRLANGDWGIASTEPIHTGDEVEVTKRDGSIELVKVSESISKIETPYGEKYIGSIQKREEYY